MSWRDAWDADPHMFENCSKVFIDVGSNAGTHIRKLYEPEKYPEAKYSSVLDAAFGPVWFRGQMSSKTGICAFGFEANPRWQSRYHEIETAYAKKGWRAKWFAPMAVSNETGEATFWLNDDGANADWGASVVNRGTESSVTVPEVDFANFIETLSKQALPGYKLMKMDIEGAEFAVLSHLLERGLLCEGSLDKMTIEWHLRILKSEASRHAAEEIIKQVKSTRKCGPKKDTDVLELDDESYRDDGVPL